MKTIVCISTRQLWAAAQAGGRYRQSTITSTLDDVGYIHATTPDQTMDIIPRFQDQHDVIALLVDAEKVVAPVKYEVAKSGRSGLFPHIYGPLNCDAVYRVLDVPRADDGSFMRPDDLPLES